MKVYYNAIQETQADGVVGGSAQTYPQNALATPENQAAQVVVNQTVDNTQQLKQQQQLDMQNTLLQSMLEKYNTTPEVQSTLQNFPDYQRGVQVGQIGTKTLGNTPIFSAGAGLIPFGIYDERENAEAKARQKLSDEYAKSLDIKLAQTKDVLRNKDLVDRQFEWYNSLYEDNLKKSGGNPMKASIMTRNDMRYKVGTVQWGNVAATTDMALDIASRIAKAKQDGQYVPKSTEEAVNSHLTLLTTPNSDPNSIFEAGKKMRGLQAFDNLQTATKPFADTLNGMAQQLVQRYGKWDTNANKVFMVTKTGGVDINDDNTKHAVLKMTDDIFNARFSSTPKEDVKQTKEDIYNTLANQLKRTSEQSLDKVGIDANAYLNIQRYGDEKLAKKVELSKDNNDVTLKYRDKDGNVIVENGVTTRDYTFDVNKIGTFRPSDFGLAASGVKTVAPFKYGIKYNPVSKTWDKYALVSEVEIVTENQGSPEVPIMVQKKQFIGDPIMVRPVQVEQVGKQSQYTFPTINTTETKKTVYSAGKKGGEKTVYKTIRKDNKNVGELDNL